MVSSVSAGGGVGSGATSDSCTVPMGLSDTSELNTRILCKLGEMATLVLRLDIRMERASVGGASANGASASAGRSIGLSGVVAATDCRRMESKLGLLLASSSASAVVTGAAAADGDDGALGCLEVSDPRFSSSGEDPLRAEVTEGAEEATGESAGDVGLERERERRVRFGLMDWREEAGGRGERLGAWRPLAVGECEISVCTAITFEVRFALSFPLLLGLGGASGRLPVGARRVSFTSWCRLIVSPCSQSCRARCSFDPESSAHPAFSSRQNTSEQGTAPDSSALYVVKSDS